MEPAFLNGFYATSNPSPSFGFRRTPLKRRSRPTVIFQFHPPPNPISTSRSCSSESTSPPPLPAEDDGRRSSASETNAPAERSRDSRKAVRVAWEKLVRWSRSWRSKAKTDVLERTNKVVVLGGGSFGTAMAAHIASRKAQMEVHMLVRDPIVCRSINDDHCNHKYFPDHKLPKNVVATTDAQTALLKADYCLHAVPVQFSSAFLEGIASYVDPALPFISLSKGLELNTLRMMSQIIPQALRNPRQPFIALSGPSFALELMNKLPTAMVVATKDKKLANAAQQLLASSYLRINTSRGGNCRCFEECTSNSSRNCGRDASW